MTTYTWEQIEHDSGYDEPFEVDGEIVPGTVQHGDPNSTRFIALVKKTRATREGTTYTSEGVTAEEVAEESDYEGTTSSPVCGAETSSGTCSREVESEGETCWQH